MSTINSSLTLSLFRPTLYQLFRNEQTVLVLIFFVHAIIRFCGLRDFRFIPLSMIIIWPLPWLLLHRRGRQAIGLQVPGNRKWFLFGPLIGLLTVSINAGIAWLLFDSGDNNWFVSYAHMIAQSLSKTPSDAPGWLLFLIIVLPAVTFSPFAEEILYRGFIMSGVSQRGTMRAGMITQATAFALVHLAHYGLVPFQPVLILFWLPSMFVVALIFGWIVQRSRSLWPAMLAHGGYNFGMTVVAFAFLGI